MGSGDRWSSTIAGSDAPAFLLSRQGAVLRHGTGPADLPQLALLAVGLAERIGAHLGLAAFSLMEVRIGRRQVFFARRADGNMEAVELVDRPQSWGEAERTRTGEIAPDGPLAAIRDVPGVQSIFVLSQDGRLVTGDRAPAPGAVSLETLAPLLRRLCDVFPHRDGPPLCTLHFGAHLLLVRPVSQGVLGVLSSPVVNQPALRMAVAIAVRQCTLLTEGSPLALVDGPSLAAFPRKVRGWRLLPGERLVVVATAGALVVAAWSAGRLMSRAPVARPPAAATVPPPPPEAPPPSPVPAALPPLSPPADFIGSPVLPPPPGARRPQHRRASASPPLTPPPEARPPAPQPRRGPRPIDDANPYLRDLR